MFTEFLRKLCVFQFNNNLGLKDSWAEQSYWGKQRENLEQENCQIQSPAQPEWLQQKGEGHCWRENKHASSTAWIFHLQCWC